MTDTPTDNVRQFTVSEDDDGIRLDRWFQRHAPDTSFNIVSRWARTGAIRLDGAKAAPGDRIAAGQTLIWPDVLPAMAAPTFPPLTGRVVDNANILSPAVEAGVGAGFSTGSCACGAGA
jgi:23S rRNA pseudouridine955/2504/2580 synthase